MNQRSTAKNAIVIRADTGIINDLLPNTLGQNLINPAPPENK